MRYHAFFEATRALQRLDAEQAQPDFLYIRLFGPRPEVGLQPRPQLRRAVQRVVIEPHA